MMWWMFCWWCFWWFRVIHIVCCVCLYSMNMGRMVSIEASLYDDFVFWWLYKHCVLCVFVFNEYVCMGRMVSIEASLYVHLGRRSDLGHRCLAVSCFYSFMYRYVIHILVMYILMYISIHFTNVICTHILVLLPMFILSLPRRNNQLTIYNVFCCFSAVIISTYWWAVTQSSEYEEHLFSRKGRILWICICSFWRDGEILF